MSTMETIEREAFTFGTDDMVARLLVLMADHENTHGGIALYGNADLKSVYTARCAVSDGNAQDPVWSELMRAFRAAGSFWLTSEQSAVLVESLVDYAMGDSPCDDYDGNHHGHMLDSSCDCARRENAHTWVCEIAARNGIEITDGTDGSEWSA